MTTAPKVYLLDSDFDNMLGSKVSCSVYAGDVDPALVVNSPPMDPEKRLILAVLLKALEDATMPEPSTMEKRLDRDQARAFIFSPFGATASWFFDVCEIAGYHPSYVRKIVKQRIADGKQIKFIYGDDT